MAGTEPDKGNPVTVVGIHIRLHLEDEASDLVFSGYDAALVRRLRTWCGGVLGKAQQ